MAEESKSRRRRFGRYEYDPVSATTILAAMVAAAAVLGVLAYTYQGSPETAEKAAAVQGSGMPAPPVRPGGTTGSSVPAPAPSPQR